MKVTDFILHRRFVKQYRRQSPAIQQAFKQRRDLLLTNPFHPILNNHPLHGEWAGHRSINITGDLRAIFKIEETVVIFVTIDTHAKLYD